MQIHISQREKLQNNKLSIYLQLEREQLQEKIMGQFHSQFGCKNPKQNISHWNLINIYKNKLMNKLCYTEVI